MKRFFYFVILPFPAHPQNALWAGKISRLPKKKFFAGQGKMKVVPD